MWVPVGRDLRKYRYPWLPYTPELRFPVNEARVDEIYQQEAMRIIRNHLDEYIELVLFVPFRFGSISASRINTVRR